MNECDDFSESQPHDAAIDVSTDSYAVGSLLQAIPSSDRSVIQQNYYPQIWGHRLSPWEQNTINTLVSFLEMYETSSDETLKELRPNPTAELIYFEIRVKHIIELNSVAIQLIAEFALRLFASDSISQEDQFTLLKKSASEVMVLWSARKYDEETDKIVLSNNLPYSRKYLSDFMGHFTEPLFSFCRFMQFNEVNDTEYALLTAIVIYSERPGLYEPSKILTKRAFYVSTLNSFITVYRSARKNYFEKLMSFLDDVVTLGEGYRKIPIKYFPPHLLEFLDPHSIKNFSFER